MLPATVDPSLVDEYGELDRQLTAFSPIIKRHRILQETIRGWHATFPAERPNVVSGALYRVMVGERGEERSLSLGAKLKIFAIVKKQRALELFTITLKAVEAELGSDLLEKLATKERTGTRKLVVVAKLEAGKAA